MRMETLTKQGRRRKCPGIHMFRTFISDLKLTLLGSSFRFYYLVLFHLERISTYRSTMSFFQTFFYSSR